MLNWFINFQTALLKGVWHEIFDFRFFHESVSPGPPSIPLGPFWIFFENTRRDTGDKLFSAVNDTGEKFVAGVVDTAD